MVTKQYLRNICRKRTIKYLVKLYGNKETPKPLILKGFGVSGNHMKDIL